MRVLWRIEVTLFNKGLVCRYWLFSTVNFVLFFTIKAFLYLYIEYIPIAFVVIDVILIIWIRD